ncbi:MAG: sigma 54-interacting transcriptional regulator [candidate division Zixibacteria bacterium]|nr:sigma 54-interacting transcriptional regulator [candidate division Zixibacteria bacterium]
MKREKLTQRLKYIERLIEQGDYALAEKNIDVLQGKGISDLSLAQQGELHYLSALLFSKLVRYQEGLEQANIAFELLKDTDENEKIAKVNLLAGKLYTDLGDLQHAELELRDALSAYRRIGDQENRIEVYNRLARICFIKGEYDRALGYLNEALEIALGINQPKLVGNLFCNIGTVNLRLGNLKEANEKLLSALDISEQINDQDNIARFYLSLGYVSFHQRKFEQAEKFYQKAESIIEKRGLTRELAIFHEYSAEYHLETGDYQKAQKHIQEAIDLGQKIAPDSSLMTQSYRILAQILLAQKKYTQALEACDESLGVPVDERLEQGIVHRIIGQIYKVRKQEHLSEESFLKSIAILDETKAKFELGKTYLEAGKSVVFDYSQSLEYLQKSKLLFGQMDDQYNLALTDINLAKLRFDKGDCDQAIVSLNSAVAILEKMDEKNLLVQAEKIRSEIENQISRESLSANNEYRIFRKYQPENEYKGIEDAKIDSSLEILAKKIKADRGFVTLVDANREMSIASTFNLDPEQATQVVSCLKNLNSGYSYLSSPAIYTKADSHPKLFSLFPEGENKISSLISIPLKSIEGEITGFLYLDRKSNGKGNLPFSSQEFNFAVAFGDLLAIKLTHLEKKKLEEDNLNLRRQLEEKCCFSNIITTDQKMLNALKKTEQLKDSNLPILIEGETGTGKDLLAKAIHYHSNRKNKKFVAINCAAFPDTLLESELFGHKKGAYTGAVEDKKGLLEEADGGTLYIDEVADMPLTTQVKLLRALEEKEIIRLGETVPRKVDIRVISATNKKIEEEMAAGRFRKDLYFRLNTVNVKLVPLRERKGDIPLLTEHFIKIYSKDPSEKELYRIIPTMIELFMGHDWPGNVRELESEVRKLLALRDESGRICSDFLSDKFCLPEKTNLKELSLYQRVGIWEKQYILKALLENNWIKKATASVLNIPESSLRFKMKQYSIVKPQ